MTDDDGGVLGNLPRSRPGQRSEKRTGRTAAEAAAPRAAAPKAAPKAAAPRKAAPKATAPPKQTAPPPTQTAPPPQRPPSHAGDPVGDAIRTVTGVAATGARVAGGVAREVLRRLPRP